MSEPEAPTAGKKAGKNLTRVHSAPLPSELGSHPKKGRLPRRQTGESLKGKNEN